MLRFSSATLAGLALGRLTFALLCTRGGNYDVLLTLLSATVLAAGVAYALGVTVLWIALLMGFVIANSRHPARDLYPQIARVEHPLYLLFLTFAGVLWDPRNLTALFLALTAIVVRALAKGAIFSIFARRGDLPNWSGKLSLSLLAPGGISIAMLMNAALFPERYPLARMALDTLVWALVILNPLAVSLARRVCCEGKTSP